MSYLIEKETFRLDHLVRKYRISIRHHFASKWDFGLYMHIYNVPVYVNLQRMLTKFIECYIFNFMISKKSLQGVFSIKKN